MGLNERTMAEIQGRDIFTDKGAYCGKIADVEFDLQKFRLRAVVVDAAKGSFLANIVGGRRGVIVPYQMIKAVGDIVIIKHISAAAAEEAGAMPE
jgi:sporulation protein YlmC with PRC-barrel domain